MTAELPDVGQLYATATALRNLPVFLRVGRVTTIITTARLNGWTSIDERKILAAAGLTAREYWRKALGHQCTPERYANLLARFFVDPTEPGLSGDILPVVPGNEPPWFSYAGPPGYRWRLPYRRRRKRARPIRRWPDDPRSSGRTMGNVEWRLRSALRRAYEIREPFFVCTREIGTAPVVNADREDFFRRFPYMRRIQIGKQRPLHISSRTEILVDPATLWLVDNYSELVPASLRATIVVPAADPANGPPPPGDRTDEAPLAAVTEPSASPAPATTEEPRPHHPDLEPDTTPTTGQALGRGGGNRTINDAPEVKLGVKLYIENEAKSFKKAAEMVFQEKGEAGKLTDIDRVRKKIAKEVKRQNA